MSEYDTWLFDPVRNQFGLYRDGRFDRTVNAAEIHAYPKRYPGLLEAFNTFRNRSEILEARMRKELMLARMHLKIRKLRNEGRTIDDVFQNFTIDHDRVPWEFGG